MHYLKPDHTRPKVNFQMCLIGLFSKTTASRLSYELAVMVNILQFQRGDLNYIMTLLNMRVSAKKVLWLLTSFKLYVWTCP